VRAAGILATLAAGLVCSGLLAFPANAGTGMLVGVDDDSLKWDASPGPTVAVMRDLGLKAIRITVPWHVGQTTLSRLDQRQLDHAVVASWGLRDVLAVYGNAADAPQDATDRQSYCTFVAGLLRRYPTVNDIVIWNEPNTSRFWQPQFAQDGTSVAPAAYEALLARCYDQLHAARGSVNVIAASSPRGNDNPLAMSNISHSPVTWYAQLGAAYRASGRKTPIFDTVGHNPYPNTTSERPWVHHLSSASIAEGDYDKLMKTLTDAFGGTGQPLPGQGRVSIWYMEDGFQSAIEFAKQSLYRGRESDRYALPPWSARTTASNHDGPAPDQATQLGDAVRLAFCQPAVGAFFNFELADEPDLAGWQSGVLWTDGTPKPSYQAFKKAIADVNARSVDCGQFSAAPTAKSAQSPVIRVIPQPKPKKRKPKVPVVTVG